MSRQPVTKTERIQSLKQTLANDYRHSGQKTLWDVGHNDSDQEDDGFEPVVSEDHRNNEEGDTKKYCDHRDDVNEVADLFCNWCLKVDKSDQ